MEEINICKLRLLENRNIFKIGCPLPYVKDIFVDSNKELNYKLIFFKIYSGPFKYIFICNLKNKQIKIDINIFATEGWNNCSSTVDLQYQDCYYHITPWKYKIEYIVDRKTIVFSHNWQNRDN